MVDFLLSAAASSVSIAAVEEEDGMRSPVFVFRIAILAFVDIIAHT
jgi:hypothetical protein